MDKRRKYMEDGTQLKHQADAMDEGNPQRNLLYLQSVTKFMLHSEQVCRSGSILGSNQNQGHNGTAEKLDLYQRTLKYVEYVPLVIECME